MPLGTQLVHGRMQVTIRRAKAHNQQFGIVGIALHDQIGHLDIGNLLLAQTCHQVMVLGVRRDSTRIRVLLQSTENMSEALASWYGPVAGTILSTHIGSPFALQFLGYIRRIDGIELFHHRQLEGT